MILEEELQIGAEYPYGLSDDVEINYSAGGDHEVHGDDDMEMETLEHVRMGDQQRREACVSEVLREAGGGAPEF